LRRQAYRDTFALRLPGGEELKRNTAVATLFENDYYLGVGTLINSLIANDYRGLVYIGYKGDLPRWCSDLNQISNRVFQATNNVTISFIRIESNKHLATLKPQFLLDILALDEALDNVFYFDPDIVVKCRWSFFEEWVGYGVALCQEINEGYMSNNNPIRCHWRDWACRRGMACKREMNRYFNSGFVGVQRRLSRFLDVWNRVLIETEKDGFGAENIVRDRSMPFSTWDQDAMNIAVMESDVSLSTLGPEGMDFIERGFTMSHATGPSKPWRKKFTKSALNGVAPSKADKGWVANCSGPIQVLSPMQVRVKKLDLRIGSAIGRFIRRT
jgi:lipopolysaccharide biosynthesis glycosyltransferase